MQTLTPRRSIITCLIVLLLAAGAILGLDRFGKNSRVMGHAGSLQDKKVAKELVENPGDAYRIWKKEGYRGRTVVFVAEKWESFDPGELIPQAMFRAYPLELYNTARLLEEEHLNGTTFLYVASMNGLVRRIVAVVPEAEVERMRQQVPKVKDSQASAKSVFLSRQGFPRWYTTAANYSGAGEPVLLYVGASYFKFADPEELYRQLSSAGVQTDSVILCSETGKEGVTAQEVAKLKGFAKLIGLATPAAGSAGPAALPNGAQTPAQTPAQTQSRQTPTQTQQHSAPAL
jgi:uncharacterized small protein (DUF1192 family)